MKKNYQSVTEIYDSQTGEIKFTKRKFIKNYEERFFMIRITEGTEWMRIITSVNEFRLIAYMAGCSDNDSGEIVFGRTAREKASAQTGIGYGTLRNILSKLVAHGLVKRTGYATYIVNPRYFYKGASSNIKKRIEQYEAA